MASEWREAKEMDMAHTCKHCAHVRVSVKLSVVRYTCGNKAVPFVGSPVSEVYWCSQFTEARPDGE